MYPSHPWQRRFQKIFEEGPPNLVPPTTFQAMTQAAQRLLMSIGNEGAGTVEYLYEPHTDKYYFLELNPRLQVEHPVTEGLTGVNLPSVQLQVSDHQNHPFLQPHLTTTTIVELLPHCTALHSLIHFCMTYSFSHTFCIQVAMGIPLYRIPDIRSYYGKGEYTGGVKKGWGVEEGGGERVGMDFEGQQHAIGEQEQGQGHEPVHPKTKALLSNVSFDLEELMTTDAVIGDEQLRNPRWVSDAEAMFYGIGDTSKPVSVDSKAAKKGGGEAGVDAEARGGGKRFVESLPLSGVPFDLEELMNADVDVYYGTGDYGKNKPVYGKEAKGFIAFKSPLVGVTSPLSRP